MKQKEIELRSERVESKSKHDRIPNGKLVDSHADLVAALESVLSLLGGVPVRRFGTVSRENFKKWKEVVSTAKKLIT